jgi:hypothetical protein
MKSSGSDCNKVIIFLIPIVILFSMCSKPETPSISEQPANQDSAPSNVAELMLKDSSDVEENINRILLSIKEKEAELNKAQQQLKQKEKQLAKIELEAKKLRSISYFILFIGLALIMIGLFLILSRRKSESNSSQTQGE